MRCNRESFTGRQRVKYEFSEKVVAIIEPWRFFPSPILLLTRATVGCMVGANTRQYAGRNNHERPDQGPRRSGGDDKKIAYAAEIRQSGGRAAASGSSRLAAGFRLFPQGGFDEGVAGHTTARIRNLSDTFWVNPFGVHFSQIKVSNLIRCDHKGNVVEGDYPVNTAAFVIHSRVHPARPDANAAAHSHSTYGWAFSTSGTWLAPTTRTRAAFDEDHAVYDDFGGVAVELDEGQRIAEAIGRRKAAILQSHGLITVGGTSTRRRGGSSPWSGHARCSSSRKPR